MDTKLVNALTVIKNHCIKTGCRECLVDDVMDCGWDMMSPELWKIPKADKEVIRMDAPERKPLEKEEQLPKGEDVVVEHKTTEAKAEDGLPVTGKSPEEAEESKDGSCEA